MFITVLLIFNKPFFTIHTFADGLGNPRDMQFTPGGTLIVSNPNANQVIALPDKNHDGVIAKAEFCESLRVKSKIS